MGGIVGAVAGPVIGGLMGGGGGGGGPPAMSVWQPPKLNQVAGNWMDMFKQNMATNPYGQYMPQFQQVYNQQFSSPYASGMQNAANQAGQAYTNIGNQNVGASEQLNQAALGAIPSAQQVLQMGMDPQNALFQRTQQQLQDQVRAGQAARGITSSPYGAGLENQAMSNFDIDWQNNALQRAMSGLDSYQKAITGATSAATGAGNLGMSGAGGIQQGGQIPYQTGQGIASDQSNALSNLMTALLGPMNLNQANMQAAMQYMGLGAGQSQAQNQAMLNNYQNQMAYNGARSAGGQQLGGMIGQGLNWMSQPSSSLPWMSNYSNMGNQMGNFFDSIGSMF